METSHTQLIIDEARQRLLTVSAQTINQILDWSKRDADRFCESEIEKLFLLAWIEKLEQYRIQGWYRGWMSQYYIYHSEGSGGCPPLEIVSEKKPYHPLIKSGADQIDLIYPQQKIGHYRADFVLFRFRYSYIEELGSVERNCETVAKVVIECDGHDFHEKTKEQAKRDKVRDRFLQTEGYFVLRFTGSELFRNPTVCAQQVDDFFEKKWPRKNE